MLPHGAFELIKPLLEAFLAVKSLLLLRVKALYHGSQLLELLGMAGKLGVKLGAKSLAYLSLLVGKSIEFAGFVFHRRFNHLESLHQLLKVVLKLIDLLCDLRLHKHCLVVTLGEAFKLRGDLGLDRGLLALELLLLRLELLLVLLFCFNVGL